MKIGTHDTSASVLIIAEIGNNHEGDVALAEELIGRAVEAGANAVKFQTIVPERLVSASETKRIAQLRRLCLSYDEFIRLAAVARRAGVVFLSTPFDLASVEFLVPLVAAYKIASGDVTFVPLYESVAATGKPIIASTGTATLQEVAAAVACVRRVWSARGISAELALLHCVASYPAPATQANLTAITTLREQCPDCTIGYSDHTLGNDAAVVAVALGARIIEKHFTLRHDYSDFRDHQLSATPEELRALVERIRLTETMFGSGEKVPQPCEEVGRVNFRRSIAAAVDLPAGHILTADDLTYLRPATGIPANACDTVVGQRLTRSVRADEFFTPDLVRVPESIHTAH